MLRVLFVNQSIPIFTRLFYDDIKISEDAHPFAVVTDDVKASNSENSPLYYTIEDGDAYRQFEIDSQEGSFFNLIVHFYVFLSTFLKRRMKLQKSLPIQFPLS